MRNRLILAFVLCLVIAHSAAAQTATTHPNLTGTWLVDAGKTAAVAGTPGRSFPKIQVTIEQGPSTLTTISAAGVKFVYQLDGSEVRIHAFSDAPDVVYKSEWQGAKVVTTITSRDDKGPTMKIETRYVDGQWLVLETTRKTPTGDVTGKLYFAKVQKK